MTEARGFDIRGRAYDQNQEWAKIPSTVANGGEGHGSSIFP